MRNDIRKTKTIGTMPAVKGTYSTNFLDWLRYWAAHPDIKLWRAMDIMGPENIFSSDNNIDGLNIVLRYDIDERLALISIYTVPDIKGYGIGTQIIHTGSQWLRCHFHDVYKIQAKVLPENVVSKKAFVNSGYTEHHIIYEEVLLDEL